MVTRAVLALRTTFGKHEQAGNAAQTRNIIKFRPLAYVCCYRALILIKKQTSPRHHG